MPYSSNPVLNSILPSFSLYLIVLSKAYYSEGKSIDSETKRKIGVIGSSYENMIEELSDVIL